MNVFIFPADKEVEKGDLVKCILKSKIGPAIGNLGFCYDRSWFNIRKKFWQSQHLYITNNDPLNVGDWCMFYGQPSKVLEINGETAKITTTTIVSDEDAEFINRIKGKNTTKGGDFSTMTHGFGVKQLPKIIASTDKKLSLTLITEPFVKAYIEAHNNGKPVKEVMITMTPFVNELIKMFEVQWISVEAERPTYYSLKLVKTTDAKNPVLVCWRANDGEDDIYTIAGSDNIFDNSKITHWADLPKK